MKKIILSTCLAASTAFAVPSIIPQPLELKETGKIFELKSDAVIAYADDAAKSSAEMLAAQLRPATGFDLPVKPACMGSVVFQTFENPDLGNEGYTLSVEDSVIISAGRPDGLFYGAQTFRQLLPPAIFSKDTVSNDWKIQTVEIRDVPRLGWRGMHLDVSRHFMPKEDVMKFLDSMASLKLNTFHWHLTDDQGWRIEIKKYPKLTEVGAWRKETLAGHGLLGKRNGQPFTYDGKPHGGYYTQDDIREVVAYAAERHITIVPEIDMPGHMQAAIAAYPELGCTTVPTDVMTRWGVSEIILNPEESTVQFCKDVLTEVMELFPSEFIHVGGDEAKKTQWENSERVQQLLKERGLKDMHEMQSWFIKQIDDFLVANKRRLIGWDEIAEGGLAENAAITWWRGKPHQTEVRESIIKAIREGHDIVVAPTIYLYFDFYQTDDTVNEPMAIGGHLPLEKVYGFEPVLEELSKEEAGHILGSQAQLWSEYMKSLKQVEYMAFPRACALAEVVWLPKEQKDYESFLKRMKVQQMRFDAAGVNYRNLGE
ncbi:beta-N-acetylhexosaminidase [Pontiella sulfatireligans]|uniref:beta-N-acetylhexosaminidase n=1 Tax=Pontiella sulfatireligans TaxID=2750658 RepID=A0A6C2UKM3_9BACT|nr:beta-N-acetylhexosaminidase [Pontiella sulfatireligans]VGO20790.1 Beta-hexosaminidase [Pontiella sulfatireligans]